MRPRWFIMRRLNLFTALLASLAIPAAGLLAAAPAMAYNISTVYKDCEANGQLTRHYPAAELKAALNAMPSEVAEYSACSGIIQQALLKESSHGRGANGTSGSGSGLTGAGSGNGGGPGGTGYGGGSSGTTGGSSGAGSAGAGGPGVRLAGTDIRPGSTGTSGAGSSLPVALIIVLILLALTALSGGAVAIRRRVVARHGT
jgi:hypothetical protein